MRKIIRDKKFDPEDQYVSRVEMIISGKIIKPGDKVNVKKMSRLRARQLLTWSKICKRKEFEEMMGLNKEVANGS